MAEVAYPDYAEELTRCARFLTQFEQEVSERERLERPDRTTKKYMDALQDVADRKQRHITVELDDVVRDDPGLAESIAANAARYISLFEVAIDEMMPQPSVPLADVDVDEVMHQHRQLLLEQRDRDIPRDERNALPPELTRRYEVSVGDNGAVPVH